MSFRKDIKSRSSHLHGVYARGSKRSHTWTQRVVISFCNPLITMHEGPSSRPSTAAADFLQRSKAVYGWMQIRQTHTGQIYQPNYRRVRCLAFNLSVSVKLVRKLLRQPFSFLQYSRLFIRIPGFLGMHLQQMCLRYLSININKLHDYNYKF